MYWESSNTNSKEVEKKTKAKRSIVFVNLQSHKKAKD